MKIPWKGLPALFSQDITPILKRMSSKESSTNFQIICNQNSSTNYTLLQLSIVCLSLVWMKPKRYQKSYLVFCWRSRIQSKWNVLYFWGIWLCWSCKRSLNPHKKSIKLDKIHENLRWRNVSQKRRKTGRTWSRNIRFWLWDEILWIILLKYFRNY